MLAFLPQLTVGDPHRAPAGGDEALVAAAVVLEGVAGLVRSEAVGFDGDRWARQTKSGRIGCSPSPGST